MKKYNYKLLFGLVLALVMMLSLIPASITAEEGTDPMDTPQTAAQWTITFEYDDTLGDVTLCDGITPVEGELKVDKGSSYCVLASPKKGKVFLGFDRGNGFIDPAFKMNSIPEEDETIGVLFEAIRNEASLDITTADFGRVKPGYEAFEPKTITIKNTGNMGVLIEKGEVNNFEVSEFAGEEPEIAKLNEEPESSDPVLDSRYLDAGEELTFTVRPKDGLNVGKYDEKLPLKCYTFDGENENVEEWELALKFEVYKEEVKPEPKPTPTPVEKPTVVVNTATK